MGKSKRNICNDGNLLSINVRSVPKLKTNSLQLHVKKNKKRSLKKNIISTATDIINSENDVSNITAKSCDNTNSCVITNDLFYQKSEMVTKKNNERKYIKTSKNLPENLQNNKRKSKDLKRKKKKQQHGTKISNSTGANSVNNVSERNEHELFLKVNPVFNTMDKKYSTLFDWPKSPVESLDKKVLDSINKIEDTYLQNNHSHSNLTHKNKSLRIDLNSPKLQQNIKSSINMYELNGSKVLIVMQPGSLIYFVGMLELECLRGCVEVFGCRLTHKNTKLMMFSLQGSCHLYFKAVNYNIDEFDNDSPDVFLERLLLLGLAERTKIKVLKESQRNSTFVIVNRKNNHICSCVWPVFFEKHFSFSIFPASSLLRLESRLFHNIERKLDCLFEDEPMDLGIKKYYQIPEWTIIENEILSLANPKTVVCGGKSVGKSTFVRYLTNACMQKWPNVLILDFDLGQCEFTIGGCISITLVDAPLLGPNYCHLKEPERCVFLGEVNANNCPQTYVAGFKWLVDYARLYHNDVPWIVNTMGYCKGYGVKLNHGIIQKVSPTHVVQIDSKDKNLNFQEPLSPQIVGSTSFMSENLLDYKLHVIPSASEANPVPNSKSRGISPAEARNLVILSYFSEMLSFDKTSLTQVIPYKISLDNLELLTTGQDNLTKDEIAVTMNGNMVALCESRGDSLFPNCRGFGIVRGVDWEARALYLITPLASHSLSTINCLMKGTVALPQSLYYNQGPGVCGSVPYVAHTSDSSTSKFARRDFRPPREDRRPPHPA